MRKLKLQHGLAGILVVWMTFSTINLFLHTEEDHEPIISPLSGRSEIAAKENVQSRREYEMQRLANPNTGTIPTDIRQMELGFAKEQYQAQLIESNSEDNASENSELLDWTAIGPENFGGRTRALALDVLDERTILAGGVSGGMWRSENAGVSWSRTTTIDQLQSVTAIVQDTRPGKENIWYYGTGELVGNSTRGRGAPFRGDGVFKSTDGGRSWQKLGSTQTNNPGSFDFPFNYVWDMAIDVNATDDVVVAAIFGGIVRSTDGGQTWTTVLGTDLLNLAPGEDLNDIVSIFYTDLHRTTDGTFYATLSSVTNDPEELAPEAGFYRSTDGGITWERIFGSLGLAFRRTEIGSSPSDPDIVYFITDAGDRYNLRRYNAITETLVELNTVPNGNDDIEVFDSQDSYDLFVRVHPTNPDLVFLGGTNLYRSTNGFTSRAGTSWIGGYDPAADGVRIYPGHHPDQHDLVFLPSNPNVAYSANDGGIFRTDNIQAEQVEYQSVNNGYVTTQYYTGYVSRFPSDDFVFGGLQDNGSLITQAGFANDNTQRIIAGDGAFAASTRFGIYYYLSFQRGQVLRLTWDENFRLNSFAGVQPLGAASDPNQPYLFINPFILDPNNGNRMYLAGGDFLWRNRNLSQIPTGSQQPTSFNWARLDRTEIAEGQISAIEVSTTPANVVFFGSTLGQLFRIDEAHIDEYVVTEITNANFPEDANVSSISVNPVNADEVMVTFSNYGVQSVFYSTDRGTTFTDISGNLEENPDGSGNGPSVRWGRIVPKVGGSAEYYLATSTGLYSTTNVAGSPTWNLEGANTIGNSVVNMIDFRRSDGRIVAASHGNGLFLSQTQNVVPPDEVNAGSEMTIAAPFPNPFQNEVTLRFNLPETDFVLVRVYDSSGRLVTVLSNGLGFQGDNEIYWDGTNSIGNPMPPGVYIVRFTYNRTNQARKVILNRN